MKEIKHYINGEYVGSASGKLFDNVNPVNGKVIAKVHEAGREEVDAAVKAGRAALRGPWGKMTLEERTRILHKVA
ncbi:MAG TPA: 5-carboxymethyl-2-hydroxymuconate semialdehyde dehydrogenase, partial [Dehalococcoidia bacterium]|nr:5-carboxymethyl-2-hydroxymuconate semialdehyde dehydrogenase [Dehalococcoidia bacterium]